AAVLQPVLCSQCTDAVQTITDCIKQGRHRFIDGGNIEEAINDCRDKVFHKSVDCLETVMERCKDDETYGDFLQKYVDVDNSRKSVNYFCENLGALKSHRSCIRNVLKEVVECTESRLHNRRHQSKGGNNSAIDEVCSFTRTSLECYEKVLDSKCGEEANNFLYNVMTGFSPPICKKFKDSGTTQIPQSFCLTVFTSLATVLLSFMLR
ncbi:hypothetical protein Ahia01_001296100, partial [Argonauta hians]